MVVARLLVERMKKKWIYFPHSRCALWLLKRVFALQGVGEEEDGRMKERVVTLAEEQSASGTELEKRENVGGQSIWYNGSPDETREGACITERWAMSTPCQISQPGSSPKTRQTPTFVHLRECFWANGEDRRVAASGYGKWKLVPPVALSQRLWNSNVMLPFLPLHLILI